MYIYTECTTCICIRMHVVHSVVLYTCEMMPSPLGREKMEDLKLEELEGNHDE